VGVGDTGSQSPAPASACGFHHSRLVPPFRLQSVIVRLLKLLPEATCTSKYSPAEEKPGVLTGALLY
jgi:hypothetical protein